MTESGPLIDVYILSYNRPEYLLESLKSVLAQTYQNIRVFVSDNSTSNDVEKLLSNSAERDKFSYIRRLPSQPANEHFNTIFSEAKSEYFVAFHDDDLLFPNAIKNLVDAISVDQTLVAVGSNALILSQSQITSTVFAPKINKNLLLTSKEQIASKYLTEQGHVPFPSYLYRTSKTRTVRMLFNEGQKHSDLSFLMKLTSHGNILWLGDPQMYYRVHKNNDSASINLNAIFSLCRFLLKSSSISPRQIEIFRMKNCVLWLKHEGPHRPSTLSPWRTSVITKSAMVFILKHPWIILNYIWKQLAKRFA